MNLSKLVIAFFVSLSLFTTTMFAEVISTKQLMHESASNTSIDAFLQKQEVQEKLSMLGVSNENMQARLASLTEEEMSQINQQIESMPAGGSVGGVLGVIGIILLILLITDILGYTKIFNFTRSAQ
jgi:hypothetical protein